MREPTTPLGKSEREKRRRADSHVLDPYRAKPCKCGDDRLMIHHPEEEPRCLYCGRGQ